MFLKKEEMMKHIPMIEDAVAFSTDKKRFRNNLINTDRWTPTLAWKIERSVDRPFCDPEYIHQKTLTVVPGTVRLRKKGKKDEKKD